MIWFVAWTILLAAMLFIPVSKMIWAVSVRRLERKTERRLEQAEIDGQLQRARFIAVFVVLIFALLFNFNVFGIPK